MKRRSFLGVLGACAATSVVPPLAAVTAPVAAPGVIAPIPSNMRWVDIAVDLPDGSWTQYSKSVSVDATIQEIFTEAAKETQVPLDAIRCWFTNGNNFHHWSIKDGVLNLESEDHPSI